MANQKVGSRARVLLTLPSVPARASAVVLTIAATGATSATYVSACPASQPPSSCQKTSTLNPAPGRDRQNFAVVALTPGTPTSIQLYNNAGTVALSVDVQGYFVAGGPTGSAGRLTPVHPVTVSAAAPLASSAPRTLTLADAPRGATAVYLGVTGTGGTSTASVAACPGTAATSACSSTTVLRTNARARSANVALVPLGGTLANQVTLFTSGATPVIEARVHGWVLPDPTRPTASTTGVPAGRTLTVHRGDIVVTTPGTVIDSRDVYGVIDVRADDVVIKNTRIRGRTAAYYTALVTNRGGRNLTVVDSELRADVESPYLYGILGSNFTAERVNIHRVIDAVHVTGPNVTVRASYLHDASHFDADPNFGGTPSHDDNIQIQAGYNIRITGNTIEGAWNAAVQITQDAGITNDVRLDGNWLDGGRCTVNVAEKNRGPIQGLVLDGNVFGRSTRVYDCAVVAPTTTVITNVDNVFTDGTPIRIRKA
jgi:hypothetical protein